VTDTTSLETFDQEKRIESLEAQLTRLRSDAEYQRRRATAAEKRAVEAERIREHVFNLTSAPVVSPDWAVERSQASGAPHVPLLFFSDAQWGEVIDPANMDGTNSFNVDIARERYRRLIERTIDISFEHLPKNRYEGIIYLRGGDMVSGDIHDELRETNELSAIPATRSLVEVETWGLEQLRSAFGRVHVVSVPGNHGRTTKKPPSKRIQDNYDILGAWWLQDNFRNDARMSWHTTEGIDAVIDVQGRLLCATHGDNIGSRGGEGFIGPAATIVRGMKKVQDEYALRGVSIYKVLVGHFHTAMDLQRGWSNGSLPGYSDYARGFRMTPEPPIQWLLFFHPKYGATSQWKLVLERAGSGSSVIREPFANPEEVR
jgi:hypothetical protein